MSAQHRSPILGIPTELTLRIFKCAMPSEPSLPSPLEAPLLVAQICRIWREICLASPELWSAVEFRRPEGDSHHPILDLAELWLSRAKTRPLQLRLEDLHRDPAGPVPLLDTTLRWASQWEDVLISLPIATLAPLRNTSFPLLRRLILVLVNHSVDEVFTISQAPLLRSVELSEGFGDDLHWTSINLPWTQLVELHFHYFPRVHDALAALAECPNLIRLDCGITNWSMEEDETAGSLSLNHLKVISTHIALLRHLTLPSLETLDIVDPEHARSFVAPVVEGVVSRSSCSLKSLEYNQYQYHHEEEDHYETDLHNLLCAVPKIQRLTIHFSKGPAIIRVAETISSDSPILVPDLQHLCLNGEIAWRDHLVGPYYDTLCDALRGKSGQNVLRSFDFQVRHPPKEALDALRLLAADTGGGCHQLPHECIHTDVFHRLPPDERWKTSWVSTSKSTSVPRQPHVAPNRASYNLILLDWAAQELRVTQCVRSFFFRALTSLKSIRYHDLPAARRLPTPSSIVSASPLPRLNGDVAALCWPILIKFFAPILFRPPFPAAPIYPRSPTRPICSGTLPSYDAPDFREIDYPGDRRSLGSLGLARSRGGGRSIATLRSMTPSTRASSPDLIAPVSLRHRCPHPLRP
ncbi:hypothetical protein C8R45DRAFT_1215753 [Mycena sanguinolenta]|nr:hypothetical protein C8R45DRAFT_1215753 [Mycena sanguinolenta]